MGEHKKNRGMKLRSSVPGAYGGIRLKENSAEQERFLHAFADLIGVPFGDEKLCAVDRLWICCSGQKVVSEERIFSPECVEEEVC